MKLKSEFIDNDDAISKGYIKVESGEFLKDGNNPSNYSIYSVNVNPIYKNEELIGRKFSLWNEITEERKIITIDITDEKSHFAFFGYVRAFCLCYKEKIFLITDTVLSGQGYSLVYDKYCRPPAIYLMDFDNGRLIYVGYFVEYFDYIEKNNYMFYEPHDFYVKMTTKDGIN